jgi:SAM-dependent methyltransferase
MRQGLCVDRIEDVTRLSAADGSVGAVICLNTLEHVFDLTKGFSEIARVVAPGGLAIVNVPFFFKVHNYPGDYWRVTPEALDKLMAPFPCRVIGSVGYETTPTTVFALGMKKAPDDPHGRFDRFLASLRTDGAAKRGLFESLKYRLGYLLVSKRAFRPFLHANDIRARADIAVNPL